MSTEPRIIIFFKLNVSQAENWNNKYIFFYSIGIEFFGGFVHKFVEVGSIDQRILPYTAKYS